MMPQAYYLAFWSYDLGHWVVAHRLGGTGQLAVDVELVFGDEGAARELASKMNRDRERDHDKLRRQMLQEGVSHAPRWWR